MKSLLKKYSYLIPLGLLITFGSQILFHIIETPDGVKGLVLGFGLGTTIVGLLKGRKQLTGKSQSPA